MPCSLLNWSLCNTGAKAADGVFIFDASSVTFTNATMLTLSGLPNSTAYVRYPPSINAGTFAKVRMPGHTSV